MKKQPQLSPKRRTNESGFCLNSTKIREFGKRNKVLYPIFGGSGKNQSVF